MPSYLENIRKTRSVERLLKKEKLDDGDWKILAEDQLAQMKPDLAHFDLKKLGELRMGDADFGLFLNGEVYNVGKPPKLRTQKVPIVSRYIDNAYGFRGLFYPIWRNHEFFWGISSSGSCFIGHVQFKGHEKNKKINQIYFSYPLDLITINKTLEITYEDIWTILNVAIKENYESKERDFNRAGDLKNQAKFVSKLVEMYQRGY